MDELGNASRVRGNIRWKRCLDEAVPLLSEDFGIM